MFGRKTSSKGATLIAANAVIRGDLAFSDELIINGRLEGNVLAEDGSNATVTISAKGSVKGEIRVPNVVVNGTVEGDVHASGHLELAGKARVTGNVHYALIEMVMGATVDGKLLHMDASAGASADGPPARGSIAAVPAPGREPLANRLEGKG